MYCLRILLLALLLPACTVTLQADCIIIQGRAITATGEFIYGTTIKCPPAEAAKDEESAVQDEPFDGELF